ncbi:hypothetical protein BH09PSE4_BH09PSE4_17870 [soil metagenome]
MFISNLFLRTGVIALLVGILIGMWMGGTGAWEFRHAHAHTNLVGWASMMIYGFFYRLFPKAGASRLGKVHAGFAIPGLVLMLGGTIATTAGGSFLLVQVAGELLMGISAVIFAIVLFKATARQAD